MTRTILPPRNPHTPPAGTRRPAAPGLDEIRARRILIALQNRPDAWEVAR